MLLDSASQATDEVTRSNRESDGKERIFPDKAFSRRAKITEGSVRFDFRDVFGLGLDNGSSTGTGFPFWNRF